MTHSFIRDIGHKKTVMRSLLHQEVAKHEISGKVVDIGGGVNPEYLRLFQNNHSVSFTSIDLKVQVNGRPINLETDILPHDTNSSDYIIAFNILEHIYNYPHVLSEAHRVLKPNGKLYGFVPFLINYHPDPHDYFRYTSEALKKILEESNFKNIEVKGLGFGPFVVNFNNIVLSIPLFLRVLLWPFYLTLDSLFLYMRPQARTRYPLGYFFVARK